jgi:hypothetical protein
VAPKFDPAVIETKNRQRGWRLTDLAEAADISIPTAYRASKGHPISWATANKINGAYARTLPDAGLVELLAEEPAV